MKNYNAVLFLIILLFSGNLFAQDNYPYEKTFSSYSKYMFNEFGISLISPKKFTNLDKYFLMWKIRENKEKLSGCMFGSVFLLENKECMILFPAFPVRKSNEDEKMRIETGAPVYPRSHITSEIKTALGLYYGPHHSSNNNSAIFDFNEYVTVISGKKARKNFNADSIYMYDIPGADSVYFFDESLEEMRKSEYPNCTRVFICKNDQVAFNFILFFSEDGEINKEKYINMLHGLVWCEEIFKPTDKNNLVTVHKNLSFLNENEKLTLDLYVPNNVSKPVPCVIVIQGGGFRSQDGQRFVHFAKYIAEHNFASALISYRGLPDYTYTTTVSDVKEAVRFVRKVSTEYNIDPDKIGAMGRSAGATLAVLLAVTGDTQKFGDDKNKEYSSKIQAAVGYAGVYDFMSRFTDSVQIPMQPNLNLKFISNSQWIGGPYSTSENKWMDVSALNYVNKDTPPVLLFHCKNDSTVPWIQSKIMYEKLQEAGIESEIIIYKNGGHGFKIEHPEKYMKAMIQFFEKVLY